MKLGIPGSQLMLQGGCNDFGGTLMEETISRMAGHWWTMLHAIAAEPSRRIAELPLLTDAEWHQLLVALNDTATDEPRARSVHQLFEAQAGRVPDAVAVVFEPPPPPPPQAATPTAAARTATTTAALRRMPNRLSRWPKPSSLWQVG